MASPPFHILKMVRISPYQAMLHPSMPNKFSIKYLLISTPFLHNQKFIFLFYISAKDKYTANNFRDKTANIFHSPSSCNTLVHNTKNLRIVGVYQRIILAIVHGQKIFFAVHNNIGILQIGQPTTLGSSPSAYPGQAEPTN